LATATRRCSGRATSRVVARGYVRMRRLLYGLAALAADTLRLGAKTPARRPPGKGPGFMRGAAGIGAALLLFGCGSSAQAGSIVVWGYASAPTQVYAPAGNDFSAVAGGEYSGVALRFDGSLLSWGNDAFGMVSGTPTGTGFVAVAGDDLTHAALR